MPEIKHTFIGGKMNKDFDERLVPNGEYRNANNIQIRTTDGDAAGTVQGVKGNISIGEFTNTINPTTSESTKTIGSVIDEKTNNIYTLMAAPPSGGISLASVVDTTIFYDSIIEQNVDGTTSPVLIDQHTIISPVYKAFLPPDGGSPSDNFVGVVDDNWYEIIIRNPIIKEILRVGMKIEIFSGGGTNIIPNAIIKNIYEDPITSDTHVVLHSGFPTGASITAINGPMNMGTGDQINTHWVRFSNPKVLNFDYNSNVTGLNVIDNLLFWTDGSSEPKKINIDRCKAGTGVISQTVDEYVYNGGFDEDISLTTEWYTQGNVTIGSTTAPSVYQGNAVVETQYVVNSDFSINPGEEGGGWEVLGNWQFNNSPNSPSVNWTGDVSGADFADIGGGDYPFNYGVSLNEVGHWNTTEAPVYGGQMKQIISGLTIGQYYRFTVEHVNLGPSQLRIAFNQNVDSAGGTQFVNVCTGTGTTTQDVLIDGDGQASIHVYAGPNYTSITSGYIYSISVESITPPPPLTGRLYLNGLEDWNDESLDNPGYSQFNSGATGNNGDLVHLVTGLTPGDTYTFSFDYEIIDKILRVAAYNVFETNAGSGQDWIIQEFDTTSGPDGNGIGTSTMTITAVTDQMNLHFSGTNWPIGTDGAVKAYIDNVSVRQTFSTTSLHTKLYVEDPTDVSSEAFIPITDLEYYNFEGDKIDDNLKEEHITVIRKAPTRAPALTLNSTDRGEGLSSINIVGAPFLSAETSASTGSIAINDTRIFTDESLSSTVFRVNDILYFDSTYIEFTTAGDESTITFEDDIRVTCKFISYLDEDQLPINEATNTIKIEIMAFSGEYFTSDITNWSISLKQQAPLYELKLGRFAYRYRYEDGEYSSFGPWSELAFLPGAFNYEKETGYNLGMKNNVREIIIKDFLPFKTKPLDVKSVDILYKPTNTANCYVIKTINRGVDSEWDLFTPNSIDPTQKLTGQLTITSEMIHTVLSDDQILRTWDNVPRYAESQEITGNRLLFGNYVQGYDIQLPVGLSQEIVGRNTTAIGMPDKSIKSLRDYKWGMVFGDKYGRETPVFSSGYTAGYAENYDSVTGDVAVGKDFSKSANFFKLTQNWSNPINTNGTPPEWAEYVKYYVKEPSNEYYNLVLNGWYFAEENGQTVWLSFQSTDRNKIDEDTYLILKTKNGSPEPVVDDLKYKVIAIENNAPEYIKTMRHDIGMLQITPGTEAQGGNTGSTIWSSGYTAMTDATAGTVTEVPPDNFTDPSEKKFSINSNAWDSLFGSIANDALSPKRGKKIIFRVVGTDSTNTKKYSRWNTVVNHKYRNIGAGQTATAVTYFDIYYEEEFGEDANMVARFLADTSLGYTTSVTGLIYELEFKEEIVENKPEFDGRFFVKIEADQSLNENVLHISEQEQAFVPVGIFNLDYIESESESSAVTGEYAAGNYTWGWGEGNGWWHNAFDMVGDWGPNLDNGGAPIAWSENQGGSGTYYQTLNQAWADETSYNNAKRFSKQSMAFSSAAYNALFNTIATCGEPAFCSGSYQEEDGSYLWYSNSWSNGGLPSHRLIVPQESGGLSSGFAYYCWNDQTKNFWASRMANYGGRPFIDKARLAGTAPTAGYVGTGGGNTGFTQWTFITMGTDTYEVPTGLDAGSISQQLATNYGFEAPSTVPMNGTMGRMCIGVTGYQYYAYIPSPSDELFMTTIGTVGTLFRFSADPDNVYKVIEAEQYYKAANYMYFYYVQGEIEVENAQSGSNKRLGVRINFRKIDDVGKVINEGIDVNEFDPRGEVRHDGTMSMGIELLKHTTIGGKQIVFESDMAIFETEPKEDKDLDIYYEGSNSIPMVLSEDNIYNFAPINCGISIERVENSIEKTIVLSNEQTSDIIKNPTHMVTDIIAKPKIYNDNFEINVSNINEGKYGVGDPIVHITNTASDGTVVDQTNGIYIDDYMVFHHKDGTRTRSKVTGFFEKTSVQEAGSSVNISSTYSPVHSHIGTIQANPDTTGTGDWPQTITDGSNDWDPACGNYINTVTIYTDDIIGSATELEVGMQMRGWRIMSQYVSDGDSYDPNVTATVLETGVAPPGIIITAISGNLVTISITSATDKPFYFQAADGTPQTYDEFVTAAVMGRKFEVEWVHPPTGYYSIDKNVWKHPIDLGWHNCYSYGNGAESSRIRDDFNAPHVDNGVRVSTTFSGYGKENKSSGLIFSGLYNSTSEVNNLNEFNMSQGITKDLNPSYGSIQRLKTRDTDVVVFTEDKILKVLSSKDALFNADGNPQLTATERVLGQAIPFVGDYGISKNPESLAWDNFRMYFTDKQRGAVLRLSRDGLTPISNVGMKNWFRDNLKNTVKALGTFDVVSGEYNLTLTKDDSPHGFTNEDWICYADRYSDLKAAFGYNIDSLRQHYIDYGKNEGRIVACDISLYEDVTVSFSEESKGWVSFKTFIPEAGGSVGGAYMTIKGNKIWKHYANSLYNSFYGVSPDTDSKYESSISVLFNDTPGVIKSFSSINYEGSQSKVVQNTSDINEFYNLETKTGWYVNSITTDKQSGTVPEFIEKEGKWFNKINGTTTTLSNLDTGEFTVQGVGNPYSISSIYI